MERMKRKNNDVMKPIGLDNRGKYSLQKHWQHPDYFAHLIANLDLNLQNLTL